MSEQKASPPRHPWARKDQLAPLHDYQRQMANFAIEHPKCGLFLPMGAGKAIDDEAVIPTPDGWRKVREILPGDRLFGRDGKPHEVLATYHHQNRRALEFTFEDGRRLVCCDEHLFQIVKRDGSETTVPAEDVASMVWNGRNVRIPANEPVDWPDAKVGIDPYAMGVIIACGRTCATTLQLTCDKETVERFDRAISKTHDVQVSETASPWSWAVHDMNPRRGMNRELHRLGIRGQKAIARTIPKPYMAARLSDRMSLLLGIIDATPKAKGACGQEETRQRFPDEVTLRFPNERLALQVLDLALSCGVCASMHMARPTSQRPRPRAEVTVWPGREPVDVAIESVRVTDPRNMTCFTVDSPDHLFLANDFIVTHNTLTTLEVIYELDPRCKVLIVGPRPVVRSTWTDEVKNWNFPLRIRSLIEDERGRKLKRDDRHALYRSVVDDPYASIWLINRELVCDLVDNLPKEVGPDGRLRPKWPFKMVVLDEAQAFKSYNSKRFKAMKEVSDQIVRLIELTGTPTPNGLMDLWPLIYLIDAGERLGRNITAYRNTYFYSTMRSATGQPIGWVPLSWAEPAIHEKVKDVVVSLPDIQKNLPDMIVKSHNVQLSAAERRMYKELVKEKVLEFEDGDEVIAPNAAVLQAKLSQLASGAIYINGTSEYKELHRRKIDECLRIIESAGSPVLVAYHFRSDKEMLLRYLREQLDTDPENKGKKLPQSSQVSHVQVFDGSPDMVRRWNAGEVDVMMIQPASAGHGLNLQAGGHTLVWYTLPWNLEHYLQTNARLHRQGQTQTVFIHQLMAERTVDSQILAALTKKDMSEQALLAAVRSTIADI